MARLSFALVAAALSLVNLASAQAGAWAQCGGLNHAGATTCISGHSCVYVNDYYSQCQPGAAATTPATTLTTSTKPATTSTKPATTTTGSTATTPTSTVVPPSTSGIVTRSGTNFMLNGKKFNYVGSNAYWLTYLQNTVDVDYALDQFVKSGMKVLRVWGFGDYTASQGSQTHFQVFSGGSVTINTGSTGLGRLDYIVAAAEKRGVRLIIPFVNNWADYGGMAVYVNALAAGGGQTAFYTNSNIKTAYKNYVKAVVSRYTNSPAIFAWELANEPRCSGALANPGTCTTSTVTSWVNEMSTYVKSLDSKHMVAVGDEGFFNRASSSDWFYNGGEGVDNEAYLKLANIDFGTFHLYPSHWDKTYDWGTQFIKDHGAAAATIGKPMILEEYGIPRETGVRTAELAKWHAAVLGTTIAGDMYWQFGTTLPSAGKTHDDGFAIFTDDTDFNQLVVQYAASMEAKNA